MTFFNGLVFRKLFHNFVFSPCIFLNSLKLVIMKKPLFLAILFSGWCLGVLGQASSYFSIKAGWSMPMGDYASYHLDQGAFTTNGLSFGVDGAWFFYKNLGFGADVGYTLHSVDAPALATETLDASSDVLLNNLYVRSDPYKVVTAFLGVHYDFSIFERLSIEPKVLAGVMIAYTPFQLYETEYFLLPDNYFKKTSSRDESFAFKTGLAIKYSIATCLMLKMSGEYTTSNMSFGFSNSSGKYYRDQKISYLDLSLGLVYKLGKTN
jgi:hypothetical protein